MTDIINILPDSVANQIAAGEVVDRPASAVKELLENALDAGAKQIKLIVKEAGRTLIQVIDDGCGMSDSDARLCFERHATSKIHKADDLFALHTMGFRGEALASIASVAQVELRTRLHDAELGTCVTIEGCSIVGQEPCSTPAGTSIAVKNLFYNVPARRNFLKRDSVEMGHIEETFRRIALAHCDVAFSLYHNGQPMYELRSSTLAQRIVSLFGESYKEKLYHVEEHSDIVSINGYVGKADFARKSRSNQYLYVNGRYIKHPALASAIEKAYSDLIPERLYPSFFVMLTVDPSRIDVNIHPTKTEVRFIDESAIYAILRAATKKALGQFSLATEIEFNPPTDFDLSPAPKDYQPQAPKIHFNPDYNPFTSKRDSSAARHSSQWENFFDKKSDEAYPDNNADGTIFENILSTLDNDTSDTARPTEDAEFKALCLQIDKHWIACTLSTGLVVIDQQLAHERILFERLNNQQYSTSAQQLLFPVNFTLSPADTEIMNELLPELRSQGFVIDNIGKNCFVVSATPENLNENDLQQMFEQIVSDYKASLMQKFSDYRQTLHRSLASRMAVKNGTTLSQEEMQQIVSDLFRCQVPQQSPSGKQCIVMMKPDEIDKLFN